jgi:plastocyanin
MKRHFLIGTVVLAVTCVAAACGGSSSPSSPSSGGGGTSGGGSVTTTTITLTSAGASPKDITVAVGSRVTFVNSDSQPHDMDSNPHPEHTDCPPLNVGFIAANASGTSQNLNTARVCGYHDHNQPSNTNFQGTIRVQ